MTSKCQVHLVVKLAREHGDVFFSELFAHVNDFHFGQGLFECSFGESQMGDLPVLCTIQCLNARSGRSENQRAMMGLRPFCGNFPRIILGRAIRFVAVLMLFVDDDDADVLKRCKNRRSRSDHDLGLTRLQFGPLVISLRCGEFGVIECNHAGKSSGKALNRLWGQCNLGD